MEPITVDNTVLMGFSGGFTFYWHCWDCFLFGWELVETHDLLPKLN